MKTEFKVFWKIIGINKKEACSNVFANGSKDAMAKIQKQNHTIVVIRAEAI